VDALPELTETERHRIATTTAVHDCDAIPKVPDAGEVVERDGRRVQIMHNGVLVEADGYYGAWMTELIRLLRGHHEPQEEAAFDVVVRRLAADTPEPVVLELGSYWAYYSLWVKHAIPRATCVMVEPDPEHLAVGERNFALNGVDGRFLNAAVGPRHGGTVRLALESDGAVRSLRTVTVDGLLSELGLPRFDLVSCDVQGGELEVLRAATAAIRSGRLRFLVVSTHHHTMSGDPLTHQRCLAEVRDAGAHVIAEHSVAESCSGDGLIVASFDDRDRDLHAHVTTVRSRDSLFGELEWDLARAQRWSAPLERALKSARRAVGLRVSRRGMR
jgi:FkbM family methyltransferase